ncbi:membrane protein required for colicin V production [Lutibacter oceani]|uniref:Membrane protein required for colicin V production n=1 Tax=Lutibacter oceani TaxID=1853311 RepID=A0A3D9RU02_9FLAO|nr:CvpA family protein [Lutibacter oceani]REE83440.1 membrane protein required for colicin V production [Lutibacter oceani]
MNTFDIIIAALLIFGFIRGLTKGLFVEVASLVALIAGIYGAIHFSFFVGNFLANRVSWEERYITIVSFAITFAIIVLVIGLLGKLFTKIADFASLGLINKILGGGFGALKIGLILSIVLLVFTKLNDTIPFISDEQKETSILYEPVKNLAPTLFPNFLNVVEDKTDLKASE